MNAIQKYTIITKRCDSLVRLFKELNGNPKSLSKGKFKHLDILSVVLVLKVATMDNYFTSKFMDILIPYLKKKVHPEIYLKLLKNLA